MLGVCVCVLVTVPALGSPWPGEEAKSKGVGGGVEIGEKHPRSGWSAEPAMVMVWVPHPVSVSLSNCASGAGIVLLATPSCVSEGLCVEALGQAGMWGKRLLMG